MTEAVKRVYAFGKDANGNNVTEGNTEMKWVLGGKGANLAEMANIGLPVPPGFTISCQTCMEYANADNTWPEGALDTIEEYREDLEARMGKKIGDAVKAGNVPELFKPYGSTVEELFGDLPDLRALYGKEANNFSTGGVTGMAVILSSVFPAISSSTYAAVINLLFLVLGFAVLNRGFGLRTVYCSVLFSGMLSQPP